MFRSSEHVPNSTLSISKCMYIQMGNKDSAPVLRDEDVAVLCESSGLSEEVKIKQAHKPQSYSSSKLRPTD